MYLEEGAVLARLHTTQQDAKVARAKAAVLSAEAAIQEAEVNVTKRVPSLLKGSQRTGASGTSVKVV